MSRRPIVLSAMLLITLAAGVTRGSAQDAESTFSGIVSHASSTSIDVVGTVTKQTQSFAIVPTDGYGVVSADGKTTYQMAAIAVGWDLKITYSQNAAGQRHADHIVMLR